MTLTATNIALGAGRVFIAPYVAASLEPMPNVLNARGVAFGGNWIELGYTSAVTFKYSDDRKVVMGQQSTLGVRSFVTTQECSLEADLLETTLANLKYILGFGSLSSSGSTQVLALSANPIVTEYTLGIEFMAPAADTTFAGHLRMSRCQALPDFELTPTNDDANVYKGTWGALDHQGGGEFARWQYRYA